MKNRQKMGKTSRSGCCKCTRLFMDTKKTFHWDVIPQYVIGRLGYHNCLVHEMNANRAVDTIDGSLSVHAVHQTVQDGNRAEHTVKGLEIKIGICEGVGAITKGPEDGNGGQTTTVNIIPRGMRISWC